MQTIHSCIIMRWHGAKTSHDLSHYPRHCFLMTDMTLQICWTHLDGFDIITIIHHEALLVRLMLQCLLDLLSYPLAGIKKNGIISVLNSDQLSNNSSIFHVMAVTNTKYLKYSLMLDEPLSEHFCHAMEAIISINNLFKKNIMLFNARLYVHLFNINSVISKGKSNNIYIFIYFFCDHFIFPDWCRMHQH